MENKTLLTKGLQEGFGGETARKGVKRGGFELESSHLETEDGSVYHDEWLADRVGGGQELTDVNGNKFTRVYAGGTIAVNVLQELGLTKKDVIGFLKKQIKENGENIRLYDNFEPEAEEKWRYEYKVIDREKEIPVTTGKESIFYNEKLVFVHVFALSPIE